MEYKPEGRSIDDAKNRAYMRDACSLIRAAAEKKVLEARAVLCDSAHNLIVDLVCMKGIIPREECALGIADGSVRDIAIISRVGKPVSFYVDRVTRDSCGMPFAILSRRAVQDDCRREYIARLTCGDVIDARVTHLEPFGAFVDIGCGIPSLISVDAISVSRISHPRERFCVDMDIKAVVKAIEPDGKISLSHKELLGTWLENAAQFRAGETVAGTVRSIEQYGIFVELTPNLAGLAEYRDEVEVGDRASVFVKSIIPERMKVKLVLVDTFSGAQKPSVPVYFFSGEHMERFVYSPPGAQRVIETVFN